MENKPEVIELDQTKIHDLHIDGKVLVYRGGSSVSVVNSTITRCKFEFRDHAANTLRFLHEMYKAGGHEEVESVFQAVRHGDFE